MTARSSAHAQRITQRSTSHHTAKSRLRVLPEANIGAQMPAPSREAAIAAAVTRFGGDQWSFWPLGDHLERRVREILEARFDELFARGSAGITPRYVTPGREILITWRPGEDRQAV
jgi:hypothetical protein